MSPGLYFLIDGACVYLADLTVELQEQFAAAAQLKPRGLGDPAAHSRYLDATAQWKTDVRAWMAADDNAPSGDHGFY